MKSSLCLIFLSLLFGCLGPNPKRDAGQPEASYIINGTPVPVGEFEYVVGLATKEGGSFCSGVLIHPQWVLTAAHCLKVYPVENVRVFFGQGERSSSHVKAQEFHLHPKYFKARLGTESTYPSADFGLVKLQTPKRDVVPCTFWDFSALKYSDITQDKVLAVGFGSRDGHLGSPLKGEKYQVWVKAQMYNQGEFLFGDTHPQAGGCHGDSGGPIFYQDGSTKNLVLGGIISRQQNRFGPCYSSLGIAGIPELVRPWIENIIGQRSEHFHDLTKSQLIEKIKRSPTHFLNLRGQMGLSPLLLDELSVLLQDFEAIDLRDIFLNQIPSFIHLFPGKIFLNALWLDQKAIGKLSQYLKVNKNIFFEENLLLESLLRLDFELSELALNDEGQITKRDELGQGPVFWACANGDVDFLERIINSGGDPLERNSSGMSALMACANVKSASVLLPYYSLDELVRLNNQGKGILHYAIDLGNIGYMKRLLDLGVPKNLSAPPAELPFEYALMRSQEEMASLLIEE